jgi:hypothetical protein
LRHAPIPSLPCLLLHLLHNLQTHCAGFYSTPHICHTHPIFQAFSSFCLGGPTPGVSRASSFTSFKPSRPTLRKSSVLVTLFKPADLQPHPAPVPRSLLMDQHILLDLSPYCTKLPKGCIAIFCSLPCSSFRIWAVPNSQCKFGSCSMHSLPGTLTVLGPKKRLWN